MTKKIKCQGSHCHKRIRVKIIKAPLVNTSQLNEIISNRSRAVVL